MLLIIEALLLILAALGQDHRAAAARKIYPLDIAQNSVDDQYGGCKVKMAHLVKTKYLEKEINNSTDFRNAWQEGEANATAPEDNLTRNHSIAIYVYTNLNSNIYRNFNMAVRNGKKVCFGSFTSSSLERKIAQDFGNKSCFEIKTCEGADVIKYSKYPEQKEVLIPPYEKFKVTAVKMRKYHKNLWCDTVYRLESSVKRSDLNCAVAFKKPSKFLKNTSTFNTSAFCRCFYRKLMASQGHTNSKFIGRPCGCLGQNQMLIHARLNPTDGETHTGHHSGQKRRCCCRF
ncbi:erythroblast NAD(P)(+)--arginine ADP-ribosyltransferase-like isoform X2 [Carassius carassius]|uniref:erythroblast NAD(P)(+)--arginine ADP-ribosyltransferase-like isoform X2 n=1 Tax=Carassius carassius TaxID=217509 RepID=UPI0028690063|nr:erythroblast NAD(P)(+)--arginine ADP-ribosyltransferase-like isoform X2 [Carassius carassius]